MISYFIHSTLCQFLMVAMASYHEVGCLKQFSLLFHTSGCMKAIPLIEVKVCVLLLEALG